MTHVKYVYLFDVFIFKVKPNKEGRTFGRLLSIREAFPKVTIQGSTNSS
jgi:hypothetical protein